jgi:type III secretion protein U
MSGEKTEDASDHKLEESREKGQVAKSPDMGAAAATLGVFIVLLVMGQSFLDHLRALVLSGLQFGDGDMPTIELFKRIGSMTIEALWIVVPVVVAAALCAALGMFAHIGVAFSMEPVMPKPEKIDPAAGLKKIFSLSSLMELAQMVLKAIVLGAVLWHFVVALIPMIAGSAYQSPGSIGMVSWSAVTKVLSAGVLLFVVLAPIDYGIKRWLFMRDQRMSKQDQKEEYKNLEGDQHTKWQRKELAKEIAYSDPRPSVAGANAVIVNPTHYAVAVRYRPDESGVPIIVAKGLDEEALRIRRCAEELGVPVFANPPLARALHKVPLHGGVPEALFEAVAAILRWVDEVGVLPGQAAPAHALHQQPTASTGPSHESTP